MSVLFVAFAIQASAAVAATLSSSAGRPGDLVVLTTDNGGNPYVYDASEFKGPVYLVSIADFEKEVTRYGVQRCGAPEQFNLGKLTWTDGTGSLSFAIPNVPNGDYYFELTVTNASPSCWRIGSSSGPLMLSVSGSDAKAASPPAAAGQAARNGGPWAEVAIAIGLILVAVAGVGIALSRRHS